MKTPDSMYIDIHAKLQGTIAMNKTKLVKRLAEGGIDVNNKGVKPLINFFKIFY